jgi:hypothetical protein
MQSVKRSDDGDNTQNYEVFELCPSSGILRTIQHFGNRIYFRPQATGRHLLSTLLGPLERGNLNHWASHVSITAAM